MPPSRIRFILAVLSFLTLIVVYNLAKYTPYVLVFLNAIYLFWWMSLGFTVGIIFLILSVIPLQGVFGNLDPNTPLVYSASFLISSAIGYAFNRNMKKVEQSSRVNLEKIEGDSNELTSRLRLGLEEAKAMRIRLGRLSNLRKVIDKFSSTLDRHKIVEIVVNTSSEIIVESDRVLLYTIDTSNQELELLHTRRAKALPTVKVKKGDIFDRWVLKQRKPLIVKDVYNDFRFSLEKNERADFSSLISAPFMSQGKVTGILRMDSLKKDFYSQEDLRLLDIISDIGTVALQNASLYERVEELAITDGLTGLYVHRYFMDRLKKEAERALRGEGTFTLLILDIDDFKAYNDRYGHVSGDLVLKYIAALVSSRIEPGDIAARYGGEEFSLILLKKGKKEALSTANQILNDIRSKPLVLRRVPAKLTVSVGMAAFPEDAKLGEDLIRCADRCLYRAKQEGKNRVCSR